MKTDNREARRRLRALDRRQRKQIAKVQSDKSLVNRRIVVNISTVVEAMADPRIQHGVADMLRLAMGKATGETEGKRECFVCCRPWAPDRPPLGCASMEILGTNNALLVFICHDCFAGGADQAFQAALQRDLGCRPEGTRIIHATAHRAM